MVGGSRAQVSSIAQRLGKPTGRMCRPQPEDFVVMAPGLFPSVVDSSWGAWYSPRTPVLHMLLGLTSTSQCSAGFDGCADAVVAARLGRHRPERGFVLAEGGKAEKGNQGQGEGDERLEER